MCTAYKDTRSNRYIGHTLLSQICALTRMVSQQTAVKHLVLKIPVYDDCSVLEVADSILRKEYLIPTKVPSGLEDCPAQCQAQGLHISGSVKAR